MSRPELRISASFGSIVAGSIVAASSPLNPSSTARSVPCPRPVSASDPYSSAPNLGHAPQHAVLLQFQSEAPRRAHRPHRVRTRRPNSHLEQIEQAGLHGYRVQVAGYWLQAAIGERDSAGAGVLNFNAQTLNSRPTASLRTHIHKPCQKQHRQHVQQPVSAIELPHRQVQRRIRDDPEAQPVGNRRG